MTSTPSNNKYAIIELNIDSSRLGYFDQYQDILENADVYSFPARDTMSDDEYVEYVMTIQDCIEHYDLVLVCTRRCILKFVDDINRPEVVSNRAILGDVRYGLKDTIIINNPYYERYVGKPYGDNGPTFISEGGKTYSILPTFPEDEEE